MKKILLLPLLMLIALSCEEEEPQSVSEDCYLAEVTASNSESFKYTMDDGKLTGTAYGDIVSDAVYTYDASRKLIKTVAGVLEIHYTYNGQNEMILSETIHDGVLVSKIEYEYENGVPVHSLSTHSIPEAQQGFVETDIEYAGGNPVKKTIYIYNSASPGKGEPNVVTIKYDDKNNPYNTHNSSVGEPIKNNPIEFNYSKDPESKQVSTYTYNELGYPVTYKHSYPDRTDDYPDTTGEYIYDCSGD
jgi:hypothetical protein